MCFLTLLDQGFVSYLYYTTKHAVFSRKKRKENVSGYKYWLIFSILINICTSFKQNIFEWYFLTDQREINKYDLDEISESEYNSLY